MTKTVLHSVIEDVAARHAERTAIEEPGRRIGYGELNAAANRVAQGLVEGQGLVERQGLARGETVGIRLPLGIDYVVALLAIAKAGGVFLPLDLSAPRQRQSACLAIAAPRLVVGESRGTLDGALPVVSLADLSAQPGLGAPAAANPPLAVGGDEACYIVFTSGSTGQPKAILGSQKGLSHFIHWEVKEFGLDERTRVGLLAPPTFDVSLRDIFAPLLAGGTLCVPDDEARASSRRLLDWIEAARLTLVHCVPSLFRQLMAELGDSPSPASRLPELRHLLLAGEPLYGADVLRWQALMGGRVELVNLYGPSETTLAKAFHRIATSPAEPGRMIPVGSPLPNTALLVLKDGELCDEGEIGEVFIKTPFMSKGYLGAPDLTAEAFVQNPLTPDVPDCIYRTGDLGRYLPGHQVELLGRKDGQVKVNGTRIELAEIEAALRRHPALDEVVVLAHRSAAQEPILTAYYTARETLGGAALRRAISDWLPSNMHPAYYLQLDRLPLNLHGKVNRRALPQPTELLYREAPYIAPADDTEAAVAALWGEVLEIGKVGVTHSFVDLGGDSLKAIRVLSRIYQRFGVEAKLQELFPQGSVRALAASLTARGAVAAHGPERVAAP